MCANDIRIFWLCLLCARTEQRNYKKIRKKSSDLHKKMKWSKEYENGHWNCFSIPFKQQKNILKYANPLGHVVFLARRRQNAIPVCVGQ